MSWRDRLNAMRQERVPVQKHPDGELTELTKAPSVGFVSAPDRRIQSVERMRLRQVAEAAGLDADAVLLLDDSEPGTLAELPDDVLHGYARALVDESERMEGSAPTGWTKFATYELCGPVFVLPSMLSKLPNCPWCWNRRAGLPVPRPCESPETCESHN